MGEWWNLRGGQLLFYYLALALAAGAFGCSSRPSAAATRRSKSGFFSASSAMTRRRLISA
jgi:hypothetical protein